MEVSSGDARGSARGFRERHLRSIQLRESKRLAAARRNRQADNTSISREISSGVL